MEVKVDVKEFAGFLADVEFDIPAFEVCNYCPQIKNCKGNILLNCAKEILKGMEPK